MGIFLYFCIYILHSRPDPITKWTYPHGLRLVQGGKRKLRNGRRRRRGRARPGKFWKSEKRSALEKVASALFSERQIAAKRRAPPSFSPFLSLLFFRFLFFRLNFS